MNKYNTIISNDVTNGHGVCVSFWVQGCPHHCPGCFNEETWDFDKGIPYTAETKWEIIKAISANGIIRNFSILGGEPLAPENISMTWDIVNAIRHAYPNIEIALWTGYTYEELIEWSNDDLFKILDTINLLIDGPFIAAEKNLNLQLRGSNNQRIWKREEKTWRIEEYNG